MTQGLRGRRGLALATAGACAALAGVLVYVLAGPARSPDGGSASPAHASRAAAANSPGSVQRGPAGVSGGGDALAPKDAPRRPIPAVLPEFVLADAQGVLTSLSSFKQPSLVVNFWATWCAPCRREIPLLMKLRGERADKGVEIVGIAVDFRDDVLKYARAIGLDYPLLIGEQDGLEAAQAFGMDMVFPFTVFADRQRRIVALKVGELHADEADFILDLVDAVNGGRLALPQARTAIAAKLRVLAAERAKRSATAGIPPAN